MKIKILYFVFISLLCLFCVCGCDTDSTANTPTSSDDDKKQEETVDLSMFNGNPDIEITVDIEKEEKSSLIELIAISKNASNKKISKLILYHVKCYGTDTAMQSSSHTDKLVITDIDTGETKRSRWVLGTTTAGATKYNVYIAYVLYEDGTAWGSEEITHKAVVTRNLQVDVCVNDSSTKMTECYYQIDYSARLISNSHVGDDWSYGVKCNDNFIEPKTIATISVPENRGPKLTIYGIENDTKDDYGANTILFSDLNIGESETIIERVIITENEGRYIGFDACMEFTVTCTRVDKTDLPNQGNKFIFNGGLFADTTSNTPQTTFSTSQGVNLVGTLEGDTKGVEISIKWILPNCTLNESITLDENGVINLSCWRSYLSAGSGKVEIYLDKTNELIASLDFTITD